MKTIESLDLELVTGGAFPLGTIDTKPPTSSSNGDLTAALQGIQSSLSDLNKNQNTMFSGSNGLMFMTMALAMSQRNSSNTVVYGGAPSGCWGGCHHGFRIRSW